MPQPEEDWPPGEMRRSIERIETKIDRLRFVSPELHEADKQTMYANLNGIGARVTAVEQSLPSKADKDDVEDVRRVALWALGLICTVTFGAIVSVVLAIVTKGHP